MTDLQLAATLARRGIPIWATAIRPGDIVNIHLKMVRKTSSGIQRRILHLPKRTIAEAGTRIIEAQRDGWEPVF
jgi:hypothetical protein